MPSDCVSGIRHNHSLDVASFKFTDFVLQFAGENLLRDSGVSYTVVRPGGLTNDEPGKYKLLAG